MGMSIDTAITVLGMVEAHGICIEAKDVAVETMHKYQKIQEIYERFLKDGDYYHNMAWLDVMRVVEDGKID